MKKNKINPYEYGYVKGGSQEMKEVEVKSHSYVNHKSEELIKMKKQYDTLVKERELLIEALKNMVILNSTADRKLTKEWEDKFLKAKELLDNLKK